MGLSVLYAGAASVGYVFQSYPRHRVESAWIVASALFLGTALTRWSAYRQAQGTGGDRRVLVAMLLGGVLLFLPSFTTGLFSDDYILLASSDRWELVPAGWQHFRPLPLAIWAFLSDLGGAVLVLHALNIALHGFNGYLVYRIAQELGEPVETALAAGALWIAFPGAVEPVTWLSGLQDVLMATLVIGFLLAAIRGKFASSFACLLLATLSKETAVCAPLLLLLLRIRRHVPVPLIIAAFGWSLLFAVARLYWRPSQELFDPITGYFVKQFFAALFGSLAMPWTREQMFQYPWPISAIVVSLLAAVAGLLSRLGDRDLWTRASIYVAFALVAALPVYRYFYVSPDLQGARYLYLPAAGWSLFLAALAIRPASTTLTRVSVAILLTTGCVGSILQQQRWVAALTTGTRSWSALRVSPEHLDARTPIFEMVRIPMPACTCSAMA